MKQSAVAKPPTASAESLGLSTQQKTLYTPKALAQGRPLGFIGAWLHGACNFDEKDAHRLWKPSLEERAAARAALKAMAVGSPSAAALLAAERVKREGEDSEPEECV